MTDILTSAEMRRLEQAAIESGNVTGLALMERAGQGVVSAIVDTWPALEAGAPHAVILCGPGNNGGDGFVVARLLHNRGWRVSVFLDGDPARLPADAKANYARWREMGTVATLEEAALIEAATDATAPPVVIDALFGIGQRAPLDRVLAPVNALIEATSMPEAGRAPVFVAVDVPTGRDADSGAALARRPLPADLIVTFHARKPIHAMPDLAQVRCVVVDIGL